MNPTHAWRALWILCAGTLMIVLDTTIVNVALPAIVSDLQFSETNAAWIVNAYLLAFGGSLLIGGRLGDWYGQRRLFLSGLVVFTVASALCGLASSQGLLIAARALQGIGGAIVDAVAFAMVVNLFPAEKERTQAMGIFGFVAAGGGALGVLAGGVITQYFGWPWIFLVNLPLGLLIFILTLRYVPPKPRATDSQRKRLDVTGAITITAGLVILVYILINSQDTDWRELGLLLLLAGLLIFGFMRIQQSKQSGAPLLPFQLFRETHLALCSVIGMLWAAALFAWFFLMALYLAQVQHYSALLIGLAFLPCNIVMALFSIVLSAKCVLRFGNRACLTLGMLIAGASLWLCAYSTHQPLLPQWGYSLWIDVVPSMLLLGIGCGLAMNPIMMAAMHGISEESAGLASGVLNTAFMMGGAVGLALLAAVAAWVTQWATLNQQLLPLALGYQAAFIVAGVVSLSAAALAWWGLRAPAVTPAPH